MAKAKEEPNLEDLVAAVIEPQTKKTLKDVTGEMTMSAEIDGKTVMVTQKVMDGDEALFYIEEEKRTEFGDTAIDVEVNLEGYERFIERLPQKGLEEREKVPYKFKPKRFTPAMKKQALETSWPTKLKIMKSRLQGKGGEGGYK